MWEKLSNYVFSWNNNLIAFARFHPTSFPVQKANVPSLPTIPVIAHCYYMIDCA
jgi:hypothetical protein